MEIKIDKPLRREEMRELACMLFEIREDVTCLIKRTQGDVVIFSLMFYKKTPWPGEPMAKGRATYRDGSISQDDIVNLKDLFGKLQNWIEVP